MPLSIRRMTLAAAAGSVALLAFALGWRGSEDGGRRASTAVAAPEWEQAKPIVSDVSAYAKVLAQKPPFGAPAERAQPVSAAPQAVGSESAAQQWRVGGIVTTETSQYLVVLIRRPGENSTRTEIRHLGEELPDGSILRAVEPTNVTIDRQGTIVRIKMFAQN
jgi:hypothetical protein